MIWLYKAQNSDGVKPSLYNSEFWALYNQITQDYGTIKEEEFADMLRDFLNELHYGDMTLGQFFVFADEWYSKKTGEDNERPLYSWVTKSNAEYL